jgi:hypothetical protein
MNRIQLPPKLLGETANTVFDFVSKLAVGETISTGSVVATVYSGVDATPASLVSGAASLSGTKVTQQITGGVAGVIYQLLCTITTSAGQTLQLFGLLVVEAGAV